MDTTELIQRVRRVELKTRGLSDRIFSGEYHSAFKGRGMAFSENREYQHGDEIRTIDWNVTARMGHPYVKVFEEERELTVFLLIDVSGSNSTGTRQQTKRDLITELSETPDRDTRAEQAQRSGQQSETAEQTNPDRQWQWWLAAILLLTLSAGFYRAVHQSHGKQGDPS